MAQLIEEANQALEDSGTPSHEILVVVLHREVVAHGSIGITLAGGADYETKEITVSNHYSLRFLLFTYFYEYFSYIQNSKIYFTEKDNKTNKIYQNIVTFSLVNRLIFSFLKNNIFLIFYIIFKVDGFRF